MPGAICGNAFGGRKPIRVLLGEDHPANRKVIEFILAEVGAEFVLVCNRRQAVEAFASAPFDLVLMDMQMPIMDGLPPPG